MRSFWSRIGPLSCHCHCYTCIENRHIQVRRLSAIATGFRRGRRFTPSRLTNLLDLPRKTQLGPQRQRSRLVSLFERDKVSKHSHRTELEDSEPQDHPEEVEKWEDDSAYSSHDLSQSQVQQSARERDLKETASELHSISIDHWSLNDVVAYEPMPGGTKPPIVPSTTTADPNHMMPQSPWAPEHLKTKNYASVWTPKKIAKMETAMALFTVRVCRLLDLHSQRPSNLLVLPEAIRPFARLPAEDHEYLETALEHRLNILRNRHGIVSTHSPPNAPGDLEEVLPHYEHFEDGLHNDLLRDLGASLVELFEGYRCQDLDFRTLMVKICHNLLVSSAPPNVQTMNILLIGFYSCDKYLKISTSHVRHLILDWLIDICRAVMIRPNEITCSTILATYRRRGMRNAFIDFIQLMRGTDGDRALMYTKELMRTRENAPRLIPTYSDPSIFKQAVYPSPMVFAEVIKGVAKFYTLEDAIAVCKEFTAEEWGYDWKCLHYLLNACVLAKDWQSGLWVWDQIKTFRAAGFEEPVRVLAAMLALCVQCKQEEMFTEVLQYSTKQLKNISSAALVDIATEILERAIDRMDDDELLALQTRLDHDTEGDTVHERHAFENDVRRRLQNDFAFRRDVFGYGRHVVTGKKRWPSFDAASQFSSESSIQHVEADEDTLKEEENEHLQRTEELVWPQSTTKVKQSFFKNAKGGSDFEEDEMNASLGAGHAARTAKS